MNDQLIGRVLMKQPTAMILARRHRVGDGAAGDIPTFRPRDESGDVRVEVDKN